MDCSDLAMLSEPPLRHASIFSTFLLTGASRPISPHNTPAQLYVWTRTLAISASCRSLLLSSPSSTRTKLPAWHWCVA